MQSRSKDEGWGQTYASVLDGAAHASARPTTRTQDKTMLDAKLSPATVYYQLLNNERFMRQ